MDTLVTVQIFLGLGYFQKWFAFPLPLFYIMIIMTVRQRKKLNWIEKLYATTKTEQPHTYTLPYHTDETLFQLHG